MSNTLSHSRLNRFGLYTSQGYLRVPQALPEALSRATRAAISTLTESAIASGARTSKIYQFQERYPELVRQIVDASAVAETLQLLLGPNVVLVLNRHNQGSLNRHEDTSLESRFHRDVLQPTRNILTAVFYLDAATEENGATRIIPGSHRWPTVGVPQLDGGGTWMDEHEVFAGMEEQGLIVPALAGDVLFFDAMCFHTVGANRTTGTRGSLVLGFRAADELTVHFDRKREVLVAGTDLYRGNDV